MENVFKALAHPIRRALLDLLYAHDGRTLGELDAQLPLTRFGTMKHLPAKVGEVVKAHFLDTRLGDETPHTVSPASASTSCTRSSPESSD